MVARNSKGLYRARPAPYLRVGHLQQRREQLPGPLRRGRGYVQLYDPEGSQFGYDSRQNRWGWGGWPKVSTRNQEEHEAVNKVDG